MKAKIILLIVRLVMGAIALGLGVWYLSSSIGGAAITYTSMDNFLNAIGAGSDIANANGCYLYHIILEHIEPRGLGIEDDKIALRICRRELSQIGGVLVTEEIDRRDGALHELAHELSGR